MSEKRPPTLEEFRRQTEEEARAAIRQACEWVFNGPPPEKRSHIKPKPRVPREHTPLLPGIAIQCYSRRKN